MKIKDNISIRRIADEYIMIVGSGMTLDYTQVVGLNDTAAYLMERAGKEHFQAADWIEALMEQYEVDAETATEDVTKLLDELRKAQLIED